MWSVNTFPCDWTYYPIMPMKLVSLNTSGLNSLQKRANLQKELSKQSTEHLYRRCIMLWQKPRHSGLRDSTLSFSPLAKRKIMEFWRLSRIPYNFTTLPMLTHKANIWYSFVPSPKSPLLWLMCMAPIPDKQSSSIKKIDDLKQGNIILSCDLNIIGDPSMDHKTTLQPISFEPFAPSIRSFRWMESATWIRTRLRLDLPLPTILLMHQCLPGR